MSKFRYIFANCMKGQRKFGVENPEKHIRKFLQKHLNHNESLDCVTIPSKAFQYIKGYSQIRHQVHNSIQNGKIPFTVGGDHSVAIGSITGTLEHYGDTLSTVWVDAHADINTLKSSPSGNVHGMAVAFLTGLETNPLTHSTNTLPFSNLTYFGLRDIDEYEKHVLQKTSINSLSSDELMSNSLFDIHFPCVPTKNIHLSVDVDVLDPGLMSSTGTPVPGGINLEKLEEIINWTGENGNIVAIDLVEFNPKCEKHENKLKSDLETYDKVVDILHNI